MSMRITIVIVAALLSQGCLETVGAIAQGYNQAAARRSDPAALPPVAMLVFGGDNHRTFLGCLNCAESDTSSLLNQFSSYSNHFSYESLFNKLGPFGGRYGSQSACNPLALDPPVIVDNGGNFYGELTMNRYRPQRTRYAVIIAWLQGVCSG